MTIQTKPYSQIAPNTELNNSKSPTFTVPSLLKSESIQKLAVPNCEVNNKRSVTFTEPSTFKSTVHTSNLSSWLKQKMVDNEMWRIFENAKD